MTAARDVLTRSKSFFCSEQVLRLMDVCLKTFTLVVVCFCIALLSGFGFFMYGDVLTSLTKDRFQWCCLGLAALGFWPWVVGVGLLALGVCVWRVCISRFCVWRFCVGRFCVGLLFIGIWRWVFVFEFLA